MKNRIFKKVVSLTLVLVMVFSLVTVSFSSASAAEVETQETGNVWSDGAVGFGVSKIYSTGLVVCGTVLTNIAKMTGNEDFQKVASFLHVWVFGGNPTTDILNSISQMCTQILSEVNLINEKLDVYSAEILQQISQAQYTELDKTRTDTWQRDVVQVMDNHNIKNAFDAFFNFDALDESKETIEANMSYFVSAVMHKTGQADKNGKIHTEKDVEAYRNKLFREFCDIHGGISNDKPREEQERILFETEAKNGNSMDTILLNAVDALSDNLTRVNYDSYADACAQVAMQGLVNLADQKDYILSNINKQVMIITLAEMMYQEYLAMRAEYLQKTYGENDPMWTDYYNDVYGIEGSYEKCFKSLNESIKTDVENRLSGELKFSNSVSLAVGQLPDSYDLQGVKLKNTAFAEQFNSYHKEQPIIDYNGGYNLGDVTSNADITSEFMEFDKLPVYTKNGIEMYYVYTNEEFSKLNGTPKLVHAEFGLGNDQFYPSCDYYNLVRGEYSDGANSFSSPSRPIYEEALFSTNNYSLCGSVPMSYLYEYYSECTDKALYQIFPSYTYGQDGAFLDSHANVAVLDMKEKAPSLNLDLKDQEKISFQDSYEGYDDFSDGYYYTVILKNNSTSTEFEGHTPTLLKNKLSFSTSGRYTVDMKVEKSKDHSSVSNGSSVVCGEPLTLKFKPTNDCTEFVSLKVLRYNDTQKADTPTSAQTILAADDFNYLKQEDGYYIIDVNMPYSNAEFVIETKHKINTDEHENFIVKSYDDLLLIGDKVNSGDQDFANGSFIVLNDIKAPDGAQWTKPIGTYTSQFKGTFDGQGYTISGLANSGTSSDLALFDRINGATIKNLNLSVDFTSNNAQSCGICLNSTGALITNCTVSGKIKVSADVGCEPYAVAGIVANAYSGTVVEKCINYCNVDADSNYIAGVCAQNYGTIINCANMGSVKGYIVNFDYMNKYPANAGGVVAYNNGSVENCFNTGSLSGSSTNKSIVSTGKAPVNCYYLDTVTADSKATAKTAEQFMSGEVAYLLNGEADILSGVWFQNIDNGKTPDEYPTLTFTQDNAVFKVDRDGKTYSNTPDDYLEGDADCDGEITVLDAATIQLHCAKRYNLTGVALVNADVTKDRVISVTDATRIQAYLAGLIDKL